MPTVLVLGGSMAGLAITHRLLKYTLPTEKSLKVVLVSKNSHFYWNPASVRAVVPGLIKDEQLLQPIEPGLQQYPAGSVEFVLGPAVSVDQDGKTVKVSSPTGPERSIEYDYLVVATGTRPADPDMPWKASDTYEACVGALHRTAEAIGNASHIVIAGAGATGVELAAEIRDASGDKKVVLLCGGEKLIGGDPCADSVEKELVKLGVEIRKGCRAEDYEKLENGRTRVRVSGDDESIVTDLYLPTMGVTPNTEFLPPSWLTEKKYVDVDGFFCVNEAENTWALGDAVSKPRASFPETDAQAICVAKNIEMVLKGQSQRPGKGLPVDVFICSMGRSRGAGRVGWVKAPSICVWAIKSRTLGMERTAKYAEGAAW